MAITAPNNPSPKPHDLNKPNITGVKRPNVEFKSYQDGHNRLRLGIFALQPIPVNRELLVTYGRFFWAARRPDDAWPTEQDQKPSDPNNSNNPNCDLPKDDPLACSNSNGPNNPLTSTAPISNSNNPNGGDCEPPNFAMFSETSTERQVERRRFVAPLPPHMSAFIAYLDSQTA